LQLALKEINFQMMVYKPDSV